ASSGVVSVSVLSPGVRSGPCDSSSSIVTVLTISSTPASTGLSTVTAKVTEAGGSPATTVPGMVSEQSPATHTQSAWLAPALKVVSAGTVSRITTPIASASPTFWYVSV